MFGKTTLATLAMIAVSATSAVELTQEPVLNADTGNVGVLVGKDKDKPVPTHSNWRSYAPYYRFAVSASYLKSPFEENEAED